MTAEQDEEVGVLVYREVVRQPYTDCVFSAGFVDGHPVDTVYLRIERGGEPWTLLLRPDEAQAICWVLNGALWSDAMHGMLPVATDGQAEATG